MAASLSISSTLDGSIPYRTLPFSDMKTAVLGEEYSLSLAFVGDARMRTLNRTYRNKDATTDVLAFPLDKKTGEIVINPREAKRRAPRHGMSPRAYTAFLFIHALLHLKGMGHGATMEQAEKRLVKRFALA